MEANFSWLCHIPTYSANEHISDFRAKEARQDVSSIHDQNS